MAGGRAAILLAGNRHHDEKSGQTDEVALYDAGGLFLLNQGVPAADLHGPDLRSGRSVYSGAIEIATMAAVYHRGPQFRTATYVCSPGQAVRAKTYALAYGLPLEVAIPETLASADELFHDSALQRIALQGMARSIDPYGDRILARMTRSRIPADGNVGTVPELLPEFAELPWYKAPERS